MDNYAEAPKSVTELRSERTENPRDWSPRDALISMLREIDRGEYAPDSLVICSLRREGTKVFTDYRASGGLNLMETCGLLSRTLYRMNRNTEADD